MKNIFLDSEAPLTREDITETEAKLGFELPLELKEHYLNYNGGIPERNVWLIDEELYYEIAQFEPIKYNKEHDNSAEWVLEGIYLSLIKENLIPTKYLPFASDWGGNYFCIDLTNNDIVYYIMDTKQNPVRFLTNGFVSFVEELNVMDEDEDEDEEN